MSQYLYMYIFPAYNKAQRVAYIKMFLGNHSNTKEVIVQKCDLDQTTYFFQSVCKGKVSA